MPNKFVVLKKGREALAYIMAHRLGIHAWHCGASGCHFSAAGSAELVATAKDAHAEQHRYDEDLARLGMAAMGLPVEDLTTVRSSAIITPMPSQAKPVLRRPPDHALRGQSVGLQGGRPLSKLKSKAAGRNTP